MADPDRLQDLRSQRVKIAEHLAWLDTEIIKARREDPPVEPPSSGNLQLRPTTPTPLPTPVQLESNTPSPAVTANPEAVLEEWVETEGSASPPVSKKGCWLIFCGLAVLGILAAIAALQFFYNSAPNT